jgi:Kef-type K+ transport system membrane component KefB
LRGHARTAVAASHASIVAPLLLGGALALRLPRELAGPAGTPLPFALFVGTALSVTAFPVLATIVAERGLGGTRVGTLALTAAAVDDVTAWAILAAVVGTARAGGGLTALATTLLETGVVVGAALLARRPLAALAARHADRARARGQDDARAFLPVALGLALALAWATEHAGVHALFGAFLAGTIVPRAGALAERVADRLADPVALLLLPTFFAFTGLRTTVHLGVGAATWAVLGALLLVAVAGKLGASAVAARLSGESWRDALALGALLNTRGLMALVVVGVGLDAGVIAPALHGLMVLVALLTTMMTTPLLALVGVGGRARASDVPPIAARERRADPNAA